MQVLSLAGRNAEALLGQTVRLVPIAIRSVWSMGSICIGGGGGGGVPARAVIVVGIGAHARSPLSFHFAVGQKTSVDSACTPALAIGPPTHACFSLIPNENGSGFNELSLLFGESPLNTR